MKKFGIFFVSAFALLAFAACSDDEDEGTITPGGVEEEYDDAYYASQATVTSSDANFTATDEGGEIFFKTEGGTVALSVSCGCDWTADNDAADLFATSVTSTSLTITAEPNTVEEELTGTVTVKTANEGIVFATIEITQAAYGAPEISVETNEWNFPATGDLTAEIKVEASADWTAEAADEWVTVSTTETTLTLTADENETTEERSTKVTLTCTDGVSTTYEYITVTQAAAEYNEVEISVETNEWNIPAKGELTTEIAVEASADWTAEAADTWVTVTKTDTGISLTAEENEDTKERTTTVTLTCTDGVSTATATVTVKQEAAAYITFSPESVSFDGDGGEATVTVESNYDWEFSYDEEENAWFTVTANGNTLTVTASANSSTGGREGTVSFTAGDGEENVAEAELTVTQDKTTGMILTYNITSTNTTVSLPLCDETGQKNGCNNTGEALNCTVDWGDGSEIETVTTPQPTHTYAETGEYEIIVSGSVPHLNARDITNSGCFTGIKQWGNVGLINMDGATRGCSNFKSLPEETGNELVNVKSFNTAFYNCTSLSEIPAGLFAGCTKATSFSYAFYATDITTIPDNLFAGCSAATDFSYCFEKCQNLTTISSNAFTGCSAVTTFYQCFTYCYALSTIPSGLFDDCSEVTSFSWTFYNCITSAIPENLFKNCKKVTNFDSCFCGTSNIYRKITSESAYDMVEIEGVETKIHLYERENYPEIYIKPTTTSSCYSGQSNLTDYEEIPTTWTSGGGL